jgi:hypothetical protein
MIHIFFARVDHHCCSRPEENFINKSRDEEEREEKPLSYDMWWRERERERERERKRKREREKERGRREGEREREKERKRSRGRH